jgi:hypothetical protein
VPSGRGLIPKRVLGFAALRGFGDAWVEQVDDRHDHDPREDSRDHAESVNCVCQGFDHGLIVERAAPVRGT